jgi:Secretion system C-terminal sorting domain
LLWESKPPSPNILPIGNKREINPLHATLLPNGDFICTGSYWHNVLSPYMIWLGKMDSTGCWYDAGCSTTTVSPSPSKEGENVRVFPNPAHDHITFDIPSLPNESRLQLYDAQGRLVYEKLLPPDFGSFTVNTTDFSNGVYLYRYSVAGTSLQDGKISILK